ncbi:hypothetical protein OPU71_18440 [Niveibacterium sp. 24ML]|uniref:hypothetical protein n=1 Tax=Niveibacterium sp. 24ML TaxID=2985512 RepID=UPI0022708F17|nr:hypothetical protein [Niveibacterium sp. 24ML]MCX9158105.1 hypothetical protein [Niveibacterium sp. 24ML]
MNLRDVPFASASHLRSAGFFDALMHQFSGDYAAVATLWVLLYRQADLALIPTSNRDIEGFTKGCITKNTAGRSLDRLADAGTIVLKKHPRTTTEVGVRPSALTERMGRYGAMIKHYSLPQNDQQHNCTELGVGVAARSAELAARMAGDFAAARVLVALIALGAADGFIAISRRSLAEQVQATVTERATRLALDRLVALGLVERCARSSVATEFRVHCEAVDALLAQPLPSSAVLPGITPLDDALARIFGQPTPNTQAGDRSNGEN